MDFLQMQTDDLSEPLHENLPSRYRSNFGLAYSLTEERILAYFATEYTIHFDDTMAYGSHHFLTAFKFQCAARESFLFGERIFDMAGVKACLDSVHLLTADAYTRNLSPAKLGDRLAILLSLEEWGRASARFCYRVLNQQGQPVCAGFQTLICADVVSQLPIALPPPIQRAMDAMREIEEPPAVESFRARVLAGGSKLDSLFGNIERDVARQFLSQRYPSPEVITSSLAHMDAKASNGPSEATANRAHSSTNHQLAAPMASAGVWQPTPGKPTLEYQPGETEEPVQETWVFAGQASLDVKLLSQRVEAYARLNSSGRQELEQCAALAAELIGGHATDLMQGPHERISAAIDKTPALSQIAIHLQNVLGAWLWRARGHQPKIVMGHSFGEIAALGVAGCFDLLTGIRIVSLRVQAIEEHAPAHGGLLVVSSDRSTIEVEASLLGLDQVVVAGRNHDAQTVMSGPIHDLDQLRDHLLSLKINATRIPSQTSFHHPQLRKATSHWLKQLRTVELKPPTIRVYSPIDRRYISPTEDLALVLAGQFLRPFDLQVGVADLLKAGTTKFVDCGSSGGLARLLAKAGPKDMDVCSVDSRPTDTSPPRQPPNAIIDNTFPTQAISQSPNLAKVAATANGSPSSPVDTPPRIVMVGQGCILPGGASSPEELYAAISEQRLGLVDQRHFDSHWSKDFYSETLVPDRSNSHLTGRVNDCDIFPPQGIDATIFNGFTRAQKLLCIALAPCIASLKGADRVLCLIGATADGFEDQDEVTSLRLAGIDPNDPQVATRMLNRPLATETPHAAVQQVFDRVVRPGLKVVLVDAACASSLYSVALGMQALENDKADAVIAGGVFCPGPGNSCLFSQFRGTTSTGCRPFDANADGVVFSEGAALITLRRQVDAERQELKIVANILGAGLSSDGKSSSANVPQSKGQLLSLERCYANYRIDPATIMAIEGHGTSTPVGDSTELETLRQFFVGRSSTPIPVHSLKGLLGHAGWAAGTASVIAACEYMRSGVMPPQAMHRQPSAALKKAAGTLVVATSPLPLPPLPRRIAVDGFGFGGANAHLVLEDPVKGESTRDNSSVTSVRPKDRSQELVFVAFHQELPSLQLSHQQRFDRRDVKLPRKFVVLPELADDMDISQTLSVILTEKIIGKLAQYDQELKRETSLILAMSGKTERGIEANLRILTPRFRRILAGNDAALELLDSAYHSSRPSGAYTLQCMMPNVAAGRAALLLNLNGPNFVVDAGVNSLEAAISSAELLLHGGPNAGTKLVIVATINANSAGFPQQESAFETHEFAAAFAITTRGLAEAQGLKPIAAVNQILQACEPNSPARTLYAKVESIFSALRLASGKSSMPPAEPNSTAPAPRVSPSEPTNLTPAATSLHTAATDALGDSAGDCKLFTPVWVEKSRLNPISASAPSSAKAWLVIVPTRFERLAELSQTLPKFSQRVMIAVVGGTAAHSATLGDAPNVVSVHLNDPQSTSVALGRIEEFSADLIIAADSITSWNPSETLTRLATDNSLCEFLFLVGQQQATRLKQNSVELWGLFLDAWNGDVHPNSGPIAGLLKSINREIINARTGTICTRGLELSSAFNCLDTERLRTEQEQEIVYDGNLRLVRRLRGVPSLNPVSPPAVLDSNSVVVATGGAKGVTALMLDAIVRDSQCTVVAIGRSSLEVGPDKLDGPEIEREFYRDYLHRHPQSTALEMKKSFQTTRARWEAHHSVQHLKSLGARVEYIQADVTDQTQMSNAIEQVVSRYGRIDLLIHGAGIQTSMRLQDRSLADFRQTFSIKVSGLRHLVDCSLAHLGRNVRTHVLTSAYSIFGNDGQHDYGAANETLDRFCSLLDSQGISATSMAWLAWNGIGMTRGSEYRALAKNRRLTGVDPKLGQRLFREVLAGRTATVINVPMSNAEQLEYQVKTIPAAVARTKGKVLEVDVKLSNIECLSFHKIRNTPTLPGAWILNLLVNAGMRLAPATESLASVTVKDLSFSRFVRFANNQEPNVRAIAEMTENAIDVWLIADVLHPSGVTLSKDVVCASARLVFEAATDQPEVSNTGSISGLRMSQFVSDPYCHEHQQISLSGPFDCLSEIEIGSNSRRAKFVSQAIRKPSREIPALLLDAAWRVGAMYAVSGKHDLYVPVKIGRMFLSLGTNVGCSSPSTWEIRSTAPRAENREVRWDRTEVFDQSGHLKLIVEDALAKSLI